LPGPEQLKLPDVHSPCHCEGVTVAAAATYVAYSAVDMAMESGGRSIHQVPVHDRGAVRNFVRFLQRPENFLTESHCRADFLLRFRRYESSAVHG
jgi:hypothetical protein